MKTKILFIVYLLFGLMFINAGLNKLFNYIPVPPDLPENMINQHRALMQIPWLIPLIAIVEITGGILFIIPKFRALGALVICPIMTGILLTHINVFQSGLPMAIILAVILLWVLFENRNKYLHMIR